MIEQGSSEWHQQRLGRVTASRINDVMAKTKSGYSASRKNYLSQLVIEKLTGQPQDGYQNAAMQWGIETEPEARNAYAFMTGNDVEIAEFVLHPEIPDAGASPDGYVNDDGLIEIKCPNSATHIETLLTGKIDRKYVLQIQFQMDCCGRAWCDFVSYDPRMPADLALFVKRVERDDQIIKEIRDEVVSLLAERDGLINKLTNLQEAA